MTLPIETMGNALRLTRAGRLAEATGLIRRGLAGIEPAAGPPERGAASLPLRTPVRAAERRSEVDPGPRATVPPRSSASATFAWHDVRCEAGARRYKLYIPATGVGAPRALVVMMHGCTQTPDDFAAGTRMNQLADEMGFLVAYPEQPKSANASACWNWFRSGDQCRDIGEPAIIAGMTREIVRMHDCDAARVFVAGLSAGGAAAAVLGQTYPDLFAGVGVHSGLACGAARDMPSAFAAMRNGSGRVAPTKARPVPTIVFHGSADRTVHPANAAQVVAQAGGRVVAEETRGQTSPGTHYTRRLFLDDAGRAVIEDWSIEGAGHAWSGGSPKGSYVDPRGPDASREMIRFFQACARP